MFSDLILNRTNRSNWFDFFDQLHLHWRLNLIQNQKQKKNNKTDDDNNINSENGNQHESVLPKYPAKTNRHRFSRLIVIWVFELRFCYCCYRYSYCCCCVYLFVGFYWHWSQSGFDIFDVISLWLLLQALNILLSKKELKKKIAARHTEEKTTSTVHLSKSNKRTI